MLVKRKDLNQIIGDNEPSAISWKRRPSEIKGYQRALYYNEPNGNYLRIDYSNKSSRVRLYYEDNADGNIIYSSVIEKGGIVSEKNMTSGRSMSLSKVFTPLAPVIATIPNKEILSYLGNNYGLGTINRDLREREKRKKIEQTRRKYFSTDDEGAGHFLGEFNENKKIIPADFIDIAIGLAVSAALFFIFNNYYLAGIVMALFGVGVGMVDIFIREREPIFFKIIMFLVAGLALYIFGYYII